MSPCRRSVGLPEAIKHEGQKFGLDANPGVFDRNLRMGVDPLKHYIDVAVRGGELHGVRQEIPQHLLKAAMVASNSAYLGIEHSPHADLLCLDRGSDDIQRGFYDFGEIDLLHIELNLSGNDAAHLQQIADDLGLGPRIAFDRLQTLNVLRTARL